MKIRLLIACLATCLLAPMAFARTEPAKPTPAKPAPANPAPVVEESSDVPAAFFNAYFGQRPRMFLVDPQKLLGFKDREEQEGFLKYHADDSAIDLYVLVFQGEQTLPADFDVDGWMAKHFSNSRHALVVFYWWGYPERSSLHLSPELAARVAPSERSRALESAAVQAAREIGSLKQIQKFIVQMTIRIYWMEQLLQISPEARQKAHEAQQAKQVELSNQKSHKTLAKIMAWWDGHVVPYLPLMGAGLLAMVLGWLWYLWIRRRAQYRFPSLAVEQRLGAPHAAGVGAVITFATASVPPAMQRDPAQFPGESR